MKGFSHAGSGELASRSDAPFASSSELRRGQLIDERFEVLRVVDRGGMAEIYEASDRKTHQRVALKVPLSQFDSDQDFQLRFQREEMIGVSLDHPNVLKFVWVGAKKCRPYIVTEYLEGETLAVRLLRESPLSETEAVRVGGQICAGVEYLHRKGVIHRDLKPDNIMLCQDGSIRIMDFGIAKTDRARRLTFGSASGWMGTADYISPEQAQGQRGNVQSDIYALGSILYEMATGSPPFRGDNPLAVINARLTSDPDPPRKRNPQLSGDVEAIILRSLQRDPSRRYLTAAAMCAELNQCARILAEERGSGLRAAPNRGFVSPRVGKIAIIIIGAAIVLGFLYWWQRHRGQ
jgi:serine/threonine-protein kinase